MSYTARFGIKEWNDRLNISGETVKAVRENLEDFFYTHSIKYKDLGDNCYSFTLTHDSQSTHLAKIVCND